MSNITIENLLTASEVEICRSGIFTAVVAGNGFDYNMYIFDDKGNIIESDKCGISHYLPYMPSKAYLRGFLGHRRMVGATDF